MNPQVILKYPFVFFTGFLVTYLLTPLAGRVAKALGFVDVPGGRRLHASPTPLGGGLAVFIGFHAACAVVFLLPWLPFAGMVSIDWWLRFLVVSSLLLVIGLVDDRKNLGPIIKLLGQVVVALLAFSLGMRVGNVLGRPLPVAMDLVFTVLWFLTLINAFNLIDGADGLAAGLAAIAATGIGASLVFRLLGYPLDWRTPYMLCFVGFGPRMFKAISP